MQPLVSIIIPNYNRAKLIGETIQSIIAQSHTNWECIVVDDGSTDDSLEVLKTFTLRDARIKVYKRPQTMPKGANSCRNYGLQLSKGPYINWFDSDDLMHPDKLKIQLSKLEGSLNDFCYCASYVIENNISNILGLKCENLFRENLFEDFLTKRTIIPIQSPIFRKEFLKTYDLKFNEQLQAGQEWELFSRAFYHTQHYTSVDMPLDYIRQHNESISSKPISYRTFNYYIARFNIYHLFKNNLSADAIWYLNNYFLMIYKILLRNYSFSYAFKVYKQSLFMNDYFSVKQRFILLKALISYVLFKKGDGMLAKVQLWGKRTDLAFNNKEF